MRMRCKSRRCPSCGLLWAGDARVKLLANIEAYGGDVALITVTAPGNDRLPDRQATVSWNLSAPGRWRFLHTAARQAAIRKGHRVNVVSRTWEYQKRGALHTHVVLGVQTARELAGAHAYLLQLDKLRNRHDFGFVSDTSKSGKWRKKGLEVIPSERAARYVAKYLSPLGDDGKPTLSETVTRPDVPGHVIYVSRHLTTKTGVTMRSLRWRRFCHMAKVHPETGELLADMALRAPADPGTMKRLVALLGEPNGL